MSTDFGIYRWVEQCLVSRTFASFFFGYFPLIRLRYQLVLMILTSFLRYYYTNDSHLAER
jgi:hypothetical protein